MKTRFAALKYLDSLPKEMKDAILSSLPEGAQLPDVKRQQFEFKADEPEAEGDEEVKGFDAILSTPSLDRDYEVILPMGIDATAFSKNPVLLWMHNRSIPPIGSVDEYDQDEKAFRVHAVMADTDTGKDLWTLVKGKHLRSLSIGFMTTEYWHRGSKEFEAWSVKNPVIAQNCAGVIAKCVLLEASLVTLPANTDAIIESFGKSFNPDTLKAFGVKTEEKPEEKDEKPEEKPKARLVSRLVERHVDDAEVIAAAIADALEIYSGKV